jgi:hypothetical protein
MADPALIVANKLSHNVSVRLAEAKTILSHLANVSLTASCLACTMWLCLGAASAGSVSPNSWRPYSDTTVLVTLGMSKGEVLLKAGQPTTTEVVSLGTDGHLSVTIWTYIRAGYNEEVANLTFSGNKLVKIELNLKP